MAENVGETLRAKIVAAERYALGGADGFKWKCLSAAIALSIYRFTVEAMCELERRLALWTATNVAPLASTQPAMPRNLIRRHEPRVSPSCTRELGPTEATMCAAGCASARTITHCFATMLTHGDAGRRSRGDVVDAT